MYDKFPTFVRLIKGAAANRSRCLCIFRTTVVVDCNQVIEKRRSLLITIKANVLIIVARFNSKKHASVRPTRILSAPLSFRFKDTTIPRLEDGEPDPRTGEKNNYETHAHSRHRKTPKWRTHFLFFFESCPIVRAVLVFFFFIECRYYPNVIDAGPGSFAEEPVGIRNVNGLFLNDRRFFPPALSGPIW